MKILIADDDPASCRLLEAKLHKWEYDVIVAHNGDDAWRVLQTDDAPQLAILDWMMPGLDGVAVCRKVRKRGGEPYTYLILLTAQAARDSVVAGMEAGADDYITKPFECSELKVRLRAGRRIIELQKELIAAREALRTRATHDPLTGLWNHAEILRLLGLELVRAGREDRCVGVIMGDLDLFKKVNDTYGHMAGDVVLHVAAQRMLALLRPYDLVGRYGGEEFLAILPGCTRENVVTLAERLRSGICGGPVNTPEGSVSISISLGLAVSGHEMETDALSLVQAADQALYRAKENGRNRVEVASEAGLKSTV